MTPLSSPSASSVSSVPSTRSTHAAATAPPAAAAHPPVSATRTTLVWDLPVRVFHWLLVLSFAGAWLSAESERWHLVHITLGYTAGALVVFRLLWGAVGSRPARFSAFVRGPAAVGSYLRSLLNSSPEHHTGHNPAGGWAVLGLLLLVAATVGLGWASETERLPAAWEEAHEAVATLLLGLVLVHLAGVLIGSWRHHENLPRAMWSGHKAGQPQEGAARPWRGVGVLLLLAVLGFWTWQATQTPLGVGGEVVSAGASSDDDDDD